MLSLLSASYESSSLYFFLFNDTSPTEIYTLSLHDALPIFVIAGKAHPGDSEAKRLVQFLFQVRHDPRVLKRAAFLVDYNMRSEEHTSELQSRLHLVCRLLLEKKKTQIHTCPTDLSYLVLTA